MKTSTSLQIANTIFGQSLYGKEQHHYVVTYVMNWQEYLNQIEIKIFQKSLSLVENTKRSVKLESGNTLETRRLETALYRL